MAKGRKHALTLEEVISRTAVDAAKVAQRVGEDIRGDILRLSRDLEIHRRAGDREKVEKAVRARIKRMNADLSRVMDVALGKAVKDANAETGLAVKYSADYTREILAMVQEQQGENLASVYSRKMEQSIITALRNATVGTIQEAAVAGLSYGEQKKLMQERWEAACRGLGEAKFIDSGGHEWDSRDYFAMNVRTNAMRVYNDVLAGNVAKDGGDLVQVTRHGDPDCKLCFPWEGRILSLTGKTKGYPTYEECRAAGCFHPNCTHSIQTVDELIDADEIELQEDFDSPDCGKDPMQVAFDLDVRRKWMLENMPRDEAKAAVRRERLEAAARFGMPVESAEKVVQGLSDDEVAALTDGVKVPRFSMAKRHEEPRFSPGSAGGHIVMPRGDLTADALRELMDGGKKPDQPKRQEDGERRRMVQTGAPKTMQYIQERQVEVEQALRKEIDNGGFTHSYDELEQRARDVIGEAVKNGRPGMYIRTEAIMSVMEQGEFKSMFELPAQASSSWKKRQEATGTLFGADTRAMEGRDYEKYGLLVNSSKNGDFAQGGSDAQGYAVEKSGGQVDLGACVRFKPDAVQPTFVIGDSLGTLLSGEDEKSRMFAASRLDAPRLTSFGGKSWEGFLSRVKRLDAIDMESLKGKSAQEITAGVLRERYIELQYHGRLGVENVESVNFAERQSAERFYSRVGEECQKHGIKIFVDGKPFTQEEKK